MKYSLLIGQRTKHWKTNVESFGGNFVDTNLKFGLVKKAIKVIEVVGLVSWRIVRTDEYGHANYYDIVRESPDVTEFFKEEKEKREKFNKNQERRVKEINKLPKTFFIRNVTEMINITGFKVYIDRSDYSYKPSHSSKLRGYMKFRFDKNGIVCGRQMFSSSVYTTASGGYQKAKFEREIYWELGIKNEELPSNFDYKKLLIALRIAENRYNKMIREL